jgi:flagella basal body P-ring formation protein FlgA
MAALIGGLLVVLAATAAAAATVTVRAAAQVSGAQITLGDVATIADADAQTAARLAAVLVGSAPLAGSTRPLALETIGVYLRRAGVDPQSVHLGGAPTARVTRASTVVTGAEIETAAREAALAQEPDQAAITLSCAHQPADVKVPQGKVALDPQLIGPARGASRLVRVVISVDGKRITGSTVSLRVERSGDVLVAARDVERGEALTADAFVVQPRDIIRMLGTPVSDPADLEGCRAKLHVSAGTVLTTQMLERIPVIRRGDPVTVTLRMGAVRVTLTGIARGDAAIGDSVTVLNPASKRQLSARATGKGAAEVTL